MPVTHKAEIRIDFDTPKSELQEFLDQTPEDAKFRARAEAGDRNFSASHYLQALWTTP